MKTSFILAALAVASTAFAYDCPSASDVEAACNSVSTSPLVCEQAYIDKVAACQCRGSITLGEYSKVEELLKQCSQTSLTNPFGNSVQSRSLAGGDAPRAAAANPDDPSTTDAPTMSDDRVTGGGIAGIVIGLLAATGLAGALGWCWRRKRHDHVSHYHHHLNHPYSNDLEAGGPGGPLGAHHRGGPTHTVVTEKMEPVVVRTGAGHTAGASTSHTGNGSNTHVPLPTQPNQPYATQPRGDGITTTTAP